MGRRVQSGVTDWVVLTPPVLRDSWQVWSGAVSYAKPTDAREHNKYAGKQESALYIHSLVEGESKLGIPPSRVVIAGHSQGAAMAVLSGVTGRFGKEGHVAGVM